MVSFERYRLILARYSSKAGSLEEPFLAWVLLCNSRHGHSRLWDPEVYVDKATTRTRSSKRHFGP